MTDLPDFTVLDLEEHPEILTLEDCVVNVAEVFSLSNDYYKCLHLHLSGSAGATVTALVPVDSPLGRSILDGSLEILAKKVLDKVP